MSQKQGDAGHGRLRAQTLRRRLSACSPCSSRHCLSLTRSWASCSLSSRAPSIVRLTCRPCPRPGLCQWPLCAGRRHPPCMSAGPRHLPVIAVWARCRPRRARRSPRHDNLVSSRHHLDSAGHVVVTCPTLCLVSKDGTVSTLASNRGTGFADGQGAAARFNSPHGVVVTANGDMVVRVNYDHNDSKNRNR